MARNRIRIESATITETVVYDSVFDSTGNSAANFVAWKKSLTWAREKGTVYHRYNLNDTLLFAGTGYALISTVLDECEVISVNIDKYVAGVWYVEWMGEFTRFECKVDLDKCTISVKPKVARLGDAYACTFLEWEKQQNIYTVAPIVTVRGSGAETYEVNTVNFCDLTGTGTAPDPDSVCTTPAGWCVQSTLVKQFGFSGNEWLIFRTFHRETSLGTPTVPPPIGNPGDWTLLSGSTWWRCPDSVVIDLGKFKNGRYFNDVLEYMTGADTLNCSVTVRSHFFGLNATHDAPPSNDAYDYANLWLQGLTVHQKSDVKRQFADPATVKAYGMKLKELLDDLRKMFNVYFKIVDVGGGAYELILEHITYFIVDFGADLTDKPMLLQYEYDADIPAIERYKYADEQAEDDFLGFPITYDCGQGEVTHQLSLFSADVVYIVDPANQNVIQDTGFVLMVTGEAPTGGAYSDERILLDENVWLSWPNLHTNLHRDYRKFGSGTMNGSTTTFNSVEPLKKQPPFTIGLCADETFDPSVYYTTDLGDGRISEATYNLAKDCITLSLLYE